MNQYNGNPYQKPTGSKRPVFDVSTSKQAGQFPGIGTTLASYNLNKQPNRRSAVAKKGRWNRFRYWLTWKKAALVILVIVLIVFGWVGGKFLYNFSKVFGGNPFGLLSSTKLKGEDTGRVNILLAGNSSDDVGHQGGELTDSIMLVSIDTKNSKAFMLSIPRDLWVHIPNDGHAKINEAYVDGQDKKFDESGYPTGGMGLLEKVVQDNFGINVNYYALVNYTAVRDAVDAVGGVDFNVQSPDPRGLYDPSIDYTTHKPLVKMTNGVHHLNGQQALDLSRARGDSYGSYGFPQADFNRTEHQRELLVDLKDKSVSAGVLANPAKLSSLSDAIGKNVQTDFSVSEVKRLYTLTKNINGNSIQSLSLNDADGQNLLKSYTSNSGEAALIPDAGMDDFSDIRLFLKRHMSTNPIVQEGAKVVVLNATDTSGLAAKERSMLQSRNIDVTKIGSSSEPRSTTQIIDASGGQKPSTRQLLQQTYGNNFTTTNPYAGVYDANFIIMLGNDRVQQTTPSTSTSQ